MFSEADNTKTVENSQLVGELNIIETDQLLSKLTIKYEGLGDLFENLGETPIESR